ncbi:MAG: P-loop NTPase fold protein, partial [Microbacterium sp.]
IKESLIGEILVALEAALPAEGAGAKSKAVVQRLLKRIDWTKAMKLAAKSAITVTLPSLDGVLDLVKPKPEEGKEKPEPITDMVQFRAEFRDLLKSDDLKSILNVVVLVDDLDRCLPDTVVETLETIRLFLSVPKMSFVIAADEERVADAIATRYPTVPETKSGEETPAQLYLHKIVQTSVPVPALSDFDAEAYLVLLQIRSLVEQKEYERIVEDVSNARRGAVALETVTSLQKDAFVEQRNNAARIRPIVHEKTKGNPRRIKRFLNDLSVRLSIAARRGITLDAATIAKLMVLEQYFPDEFKEVTGWLREQTLRQNMFVLELQAGTPSAEDGDEALESADESGDSEGTEEAAGATTPRQSDAKTEELEQRFSEALIRWARLSPPLAKKDIAPYLVFAASFKSVFLASEGLPESIRDIATQLLSRSPSEARRVTEDMLRSLQPAEATRLINHIGGVIVDDPQKQSAGVVAMLRIARVQSGAISAVVAALKRIKPSDLKIGGLAQLQADDPEEIVEQLTTMADVSGKPELVEAVAAAKEGI